MKNLTAKAGWLLLLAVLAVPSFLFYNWWTENRRQASAETAAEPVQANIFPAAEKDRPAELPGKAPAAAQRQPQPQVPAVSTRPVVQAAVLPSAPAQASTPSVPSASVQAPQAALQQPVEISTPAVQPVALSTGSYFSPRTERDPVLSPADYSRIKEAELRRLENERMQRLASRRRPQEPQIESRIHLQGIVGDAAIINGEMYYVGQSVYGAKILKVGANYVIGEHKGRRFRKVLK